MGRSPCRPFLSYGELLVLLLQHHLPSYKRWVIKGLNFGRDQADVVLRGYSGYNTRWALKVMSRAFDGLCADGEWPLALTVFFGANDASIPDRSSGFQHVPLDEYQSNLRSIISFFKVL